MTELTFVRHCESTLNLEPDVICGRSNTTPVTQRGKRQATLLGQYFRKYDYRPDVVYSSGAVRADATARYALDTAGYRQDITTDERLQELSQGRFEGRIRSEVYTADMVAAHQLNELHGALPGAESIHNGATRMMDFMDDTYRTHPDGKILVFGHGLAIRALAGMINNQSKQEIISLTTDNVSLTKIVRTPDETVVEYVGKRVVTE